MKVIDIVKESIESGTPADYNAAKIAALKDELAHMPRFPRTQEEYDAIDDLRYKIKQLGGTLEEASEYGSASDAYAAHSERAQAALQSISTKLADHRERAGQQAENWGFAGDVEEIANRLAEIDEFLQ